MNNPNDYKKQYERGLKRKLELIKYKGGKCEMCSYCKNISALEFHHINPEEKSFQLDMRHLSNTHIDKLKEEADKCILLCSNCHREIHHPDLCIENVECILSEFETNNVKIMDDKRKMSICPVCGQKFPKLKGKIFCSDNCRNESKHYPSYEEVYEKYKELKSWEMVANFYGLTRKIIQGIRKKKQ